MARIESFCERARKISGEGRGACRIGRGNDPCAVRNSLELKTEIAGTANATEEVGEEACEGIEEHGECIPLDSAAFCTVKITYLNDGKRVKHDGKQ